MVNGGDRSKNGLYRVRDTNGDDQLDSVELLRLANGDGEHGPHAVLPAPDGKSLYVVCGNNTQPIEGARSRVSEIWDEDQLLPRIYGVGFMRGVPAPAGAIYKIDPDGKEWERVTSGFRNPFDIALNADGELFTFDADMEWDIGTPWYRPTRVCHAVSGGEWGWRNGSAQVARLFCRHAAARGQHRPRFADRHHVWLRREIPGQVPERAVHLRLDVRQDVRRASGAAGGFVHGHGRRIHVRPRRCRSPMRSSIRTTARCTF